MADISQLLRKNNQGGYKNIFPKTYLDNIIDKESGMTLSDILSGFNMYFLSYTGSRSQTRLQVPKVLRKNGLWITYVLFDNTVVTEWYNNSSIDDTAWQDNSNWRDGSNSLVGDISISSDGNWVIKGVETDIPARGSKGEKGDGWECKGFVDAVGNLPSSGQTIGDLYLVGTTEPYDVYVYKGSSYGWVNIGNALEIKASVIDGGRADSKYGGARTFDCGGADAYLY